MEVRPSAPTSQRATILLCAFLIATLSAIAQTVSSTVKGTIVDSSGAVVPGATCKLTNTATNGQIAVLTGPDGTFQFLDVLAGTYTLAVSAPGFKNYELTNVEVLASEFHAVGNIVLRVGQASESLVVADTAAPVQLASGERSDTITGTQLNDVAVKGRDFVSYLSTLTAWSTRTPAEMRCSAMLCRESTSTAAATHR